METLESKILRLRREMFECGIVRWVFVLVVEDENVCVKYKLFKKSSVLTLGSCLYLLAVKS